MWPRRETVTADMACLVRLVLQASASVISLAMNTCGPRMRGRRWGCQHRRVGVAHRLSLTVSVLLTTGRRARAADEEDSLGIGERLSHTELCSTERALPHLGSSRSLSGPTRRVRTATANT